MAWSYGYENLIGFFDKHANIWERFFIVYIFWLLFTTFANAMSEQEWQRRVENFGIYFILNDVVCVYSCLDDDDEIDGNLIGQPRARPKNVVMKKHANFWH